MKSTRGNLFTQVKNPRVPSNTFDLSYDCKFSTKMGLLTPVHIQECVPGDVFTQSVSSLIRFAPLVAPVMHQVNCYTHFYFVPSRILWPNWETFITANNQGTPPVLPYLTGLTFATSSLGDYLGLPTGIGISEKISALPFAAYQMIYNEYYRDQNLVTPINFELTDGNNSSNGSLTAMRTRAWEHDYFTSCLPFAQKGDAVTIPIADFNDVPITFQQDTGGTYFKWADGFSRAPDASGTSVGSYGLDQPANTGFGLEAEAADESILRVNIDNSSNLTAKTSELTGTEATINDLRKAYAIQRWLEKLARGGSRYIELIKAMFDVNSPDARLQRPEYLGGSKQPVVISEVLQTSASADDSTAQGNMAGHGYSIGSGKQFSYKCVEHGYIIGIQSVMPRTAYQQGLPRMWSKFDNLDYYWPEFSHLGEQEVLSKEVFYNGSDDAYNNSTFGYIPRYSEYKYNASRVSGDFRTNLAFWHMGRIFDSPPALNGNFVTSNPTDRIFAVEDGTDTLWCQVFHIIKANRKMPIFGTPNP